MNRFLTLMIATLTLALPIGLTTELISAYGLDTVARKASLSLRKQYPLRQQLTDELADDPRIPLERIDDWEWQAIRSLSEPLQTTLPYAEQWLMQQDQTQAVTFTVLAQQGRVLELASLRQPTALGGLIVEVFNMESNDSRPVASMGPTDERLRWPVSDTGTYRIRAQSTPGTVGAFGLSLDQRFAFDFPVATDSADPVKSLFGVPRDGGRREHHGIDIFAPRHAPVLAAADGYITRVGTSTRGGLHIWQRAIDDANNPIGALYYAHLEDTRVTAGTWVDRGTQIGTVGNSGNAISTPPHLHFGFYQRFQGPLDPLPWTGSARQPEVSAAIGHRWPAWVSIARESVNVRVGPGTEHPIKDTAERGEIVSLQAASEGWLRIQTGAGVTGFIADSLIGALLAQPIVLSEATLIQGAPVQSSPILVELTSQQPAILLGRFGPARHVETETGLRGWVLDAITKTGDEPAS